MKDNHKNLLIGCLLGIIGFLILIISNLNKMVSKIKNRKNVYKKIRIIKETDLLIPKNTSKEEINTMVEEITSTDTSENTYYSWKNFNSRKVYKIKKAEC